MARDRLYAAPQADLVDFRFDGEVARVFPDMIRRSVPGYDTIIALTGLIARQFARPGSRIYDLGSSLGASMAAVLKWVEIADIEPVCVDNSAAMLQRCRANLDALYGPGKIHYQQQDLVDFTPTNASVMVLNFVLQFIAPDERMGVLARLAAGLVPGGVLVISEKVTGEGELPNTLHQAFKKANGYSELEISQKRSALEKVMVLDTPQQHYTRLAAAGLVDCEQWFQALNFRSFIAFKP